MNKEEMLKELRRTNENYPPAYKTISPDDSSSLAHPTYVSSKLNETKSA